MPMPVSLTEHSIVAASAVCCRQRAAISIAAGFGELDGIGREIEDHLPQPRLVADQRRRQVRARSTARIDRPFSAARAATMLTALSISAAGENGASLEFDLAGVELRHVENVVEQAQQAVAQFVDRIDQVASARCRGRSRATPTTGRSRRSSACGFRGSSSRETPTSPGWPQAPRDADGAVLRLPPPRGACFSSARTRSVMSEWRTTQPPAARG